MDDPRHNDDLRPAPAISKTRWQCWYGPALILLVGAALYLPARDWGLPAVHSWSQDTIAGMRTIVALDGADGVFRGRYPPLHYWINRTAYAPVLAAWRSQGAVREDPQSGLPVPTPPMAPKVGQLLSISRWITFVMALAAGLGVWAAARTLTRDGPLATLAALLLMSGADFTYFAHLGNVDVPAMCWVAWSIFFYVRLLHRTTFWDGTMLGLAAALAVCTKDGAAGLYPGMALVLLIRGIDEWRHAQAPGRIAVRHLTAWIAGLAVFAVLYLIINGVFTDFDAYRARMAYWLDDTANTLHAQQYRYPDQLSLLGATARFAASAVGWPMLAVYLAAVVYTIARHRRWALYLVLPALSYYVLVIARLDFVYARFLFPPLALLAILAAVSIMDFVRKAPWPETLRFALPCIVILPGFGYAAAVNLEMLTDSRYQAEAWFEEHVEQGASIGAFSKPQYLPRLQDRGYATYAVTMEPASFTVPQPEYLVLTSYNFEDFTAEQEACRRDLIDGKLGYETVVVFRRRFLGAGGSWLGIAGWGTERIGKISPTLIVLHRKPADASGQPAPSPVPVPSR